jgi:hypothetical protein
MRAVRRSGRATSAARIQPFSAPLLPDVAGVPGITLDKPQSPLCVALLMSDAEWPDNLLSGCEVSNKRSALGSAAPLGIVTKKSATFPEQRFCWIPLTTVFIMQLRGGPTQEGRPWTCVNNC